MYYHNNELPPQQGWICPKCGRVNAPWMPTCGCVSSQTSGSGAPYIPYLVKTSSISRDSHEQADTPQTEMDKCYKCKWWNYSYGCSNKKGICDFEQADTPQTERIKTTDYCDICNHNGCDNCIANNLDDYCVPSGYAPKDTPHTDCETCRHYKLACELFSEVCKYEPTTLTETENSN